MSVAQVSVGTVAAGFLWEEPRRYWWAFAPDYPHEPFRPVLGQWFEDRLLRSRIGFDRFPSWFENILPDPDGALRRRVCRELALDENDCFGLLMALGHSLPGATRVSRSESSHDEHPSEAERVESGPELSGAFRISLGGVQLKFGLSGSPDRLTVPVRGDEQDSQWILKVAGDHLPDLAANEASMMRWAAASGLAAPEVHVVEREAFPDLGELPSDVGNGLLVKRFDREGGTRIHQEDFAQVLGVRPLKRYDGGDTRKVAAVARAILGRAGLEEMIRRLVFMIASGNMDAHLKNWSLLYSDGVSASWTPVYDQVCTRHYPTLNRRFALALRHAHYPEEVDHRVLLSFWSDVASKYGDPVDPQLIDSVVQQITSAFRPEELGMPRELERTLRAYWQEVPLLRGRLTTELDPR